MSDVNLNSCVLERNPRLPFNVADLGVDVTSCQVNHKFALRELLHSVQYMTPLTSESDMENPH